MARGPRPPQSTRRRAKPKAAKTSRTARPHHVGSALAALRDEVAALRRGIGAQAQVISRARLEEIPRPEDFQPLADHLYDFARVAPGLFTSLESVRLTVEHADGVTRNLVEVTDTLVATYQSWTDSLMRLPRAEDYEPLVGPLREFARVAPVLAETLASVVKAATPLPALMDRLLAADTAVRTGLAAAVERMGAARTVIREGLAILPRDKAYAGAADQLRELATVSPSLMDWMKQLPALTMPLAEAIAALEQAAQELEDGEQSARQLLEMQRQP